MATSTFTFTGKECGDYDHRNWNPKQNYGKRGKIKPKALYELGNLTNPLPKEVRDVQEIQNFYKNVKVVRFDGREFNLVPYAGTYHNSGDCLLGFYQMLNDLAPTQSSALGSIKHYSFGGKIDIIRSQDSEFELEQEEQISAQLKSQFLNDVLKKILLEEISWNNLAEKIWESGKDTGNAYLELVLTDTLGERSAALHWHKTEYCRYLATEKGEQKFIAISPAWDSPKLMTDGKYLEENPPEILPKYPMFETNERTGVSRTIIHWKNGCFEWYGRPDSAGSVLDQYTEFADTVYRLKASANNFTPQLIVEAEDDNPEETNRDAQEAGFENEAERFAENYTNEGENPSSVIYTSRPFGAKPLFVAQIAPNTNENYYAVTGKLSRDRIIESHAWSSRLMMDDAATGLNSSDAQLAALKAKLPVVRKNQSIPEWVIGKALDSIVEFFGNTQYQDIKLKFKSPYAEMLEQVEEAQEEQNANQNNLNNGNADD